MHSDTVNFFYSDKPEMIFKPVSREIKSWKEEVLQTARNINAIKKKPLMVCISGGIDGEVAARAFLENNIEFSVLTLKHSSGTNDHDIKYAVEFCKKFNIEHHIVNFDPKFFFNDKMQDFIDKGYKTWRPFRLFQLFLLETAESMGYCAVLGGGEQIYETVNGEICIKYPPEFTMCLKWCQDNNTQHFPYFFMQNPEVYAAYMKTDIVDTLLKNPNYYLNPVYNTSLEKILVYHSNWLNMPRRPKFEGWEKVQNLRKEAIDKYKKQVPVLPELVLPVSLIKTQLQI